MPEVNFDYFKEDSKMAEINLDYFQNEKQCCRDFLNYHIGKEVVIEGYLISYGHKGSALVIGCSFFDNDTFIDLGHMWWQNCAQLIMQHSQNIHVPCYIKCQGIVGAYTGSDNISSHNFFPSNVIQIRNTGLADNININELLSNYKK